MVWLNRQCIGNEIVKKHLQYIADNNRIHHAYLFSGPRGVGKFTMALDFTRYINCESKTTTKKCSCNVCRQIQLPWPFHPDFHMLRNTLTPIVVDFSEITRQFQIVSHQKVTAKTLLEQYLSFIEKCLKHNILKSVKTVLSNRMNRIDVCFLQDTELQEHSFKFSENMTPFIYWLINRFSTYLINHLYVKTIKINQIRTLQKALSFHPFQASYKIAIIDDVENMTIQSQNSLLKTLEEPPGHAVLILVTSNPSALLPTIRSRCQHFHFQSLSKKDFNMVFKKNFDEIDINLETAYHYSQGSVSRLFQTDWEQLEKKENLFQELLFSNRDTQKYEWIFTLVHHLYPAGESPENRKSTMIEFQLWLYKLIKKNIFSPMSKPDLQSEKELDLGKIIKLIETMDNLIELNNTGLDIKLQLENRLFSLLGS